MPSPETVAESLGIQAKQGRSWRCNCPVCGGHNFHVTPAKPGTLNPLVYCWNSCETDEVIQALKDRGLWTERVSGSSEKKAQSARKSPAHELSSAPQVDMTKPPDTVYTYYKPDGTPVADKGRWQAGSQKSFKWRKHGDKEWSGLPKGLKMPDLPLYHAEQLATQPEGPVYVVEGEKCVDKLALEGQLAVCVGGGSGQKDLADCFAILVERDVVLWPDNDAPGRLHMHGVAEAVEASAASLQMVVVEGAKKGDDVVDYLGNGGLLADLVQTDYSTQATVAALEGEACFQVNIPMGDGSILLEALNMVHKSHRLDCDLAVRMTVPGANHETFMSRTNLLSLSGRDTYRRSLDQMFGKEWDWTRRLNTATDLLRQAYLLADPAEWLDEVNPSPRQSRFRLAPFLPNRQPSIIFGDGEAGKTFTAYVCAVCLANGMAFLDHDPPDNRGTTVMVIDYETDRETAKRRILRLLKGFELEWPAKRLLYWPGRGISLAAQAEALKRKVKEWDVGLVIVDSAAAACGEPREESAVLAYFNALASLGTTSLTIAHVTKGQHSDKFRPFGSTFWHNMARSTWFAARGSTRDPETVQVGLVNRKMSDGARAKSVSLTMEFDDSDPLGGIKLGVGDADEVAELRNERPPPMRVMALLRTMRMAAQRGSGLSLERQLTLEEISDQCDLKPELCARVLAGLKSKGHAVDDKGNWSLPMLKQDGDEKP